MLEGVGGSPQVNAQGLSATCRLPQNPPLVMNTLAASAKLCARPIVAIRIHRAHHDILKLPAIRNAAASSILVAPAVPLLCLLYQRSPCVNRARRSKGARSLNRYSYGRHHQSRLTGLCSEIVGQQYGLNPSQQLFHAVDHP